MRAYKLALFILSLLITPALAHAETLLKDNQGNELSLSNLKGKWVYINYWASWCPTCLEEIPEFNRFYEHHKKQKTVALYAVNFDGLPQAEQHSLIKRFNIQYPSLLEDPCAQLHLGDIRGIPVTFIFNPKGELVETLYGGQTAETLNQVIERG
ncbi:TlpA disulfide reductase family protein [Legionella sp. km772]|uniref:TlpA family protein disulfide reductase n=1 Tax=Legionella sp. km772 TaxID=2498111 RepID=UPI000F8CF87D|nr:TlpA disulfide reductase family protein [Legionella sp. km772]RUR05379.1 TlpA family protein disulfide reductase [Legionella sp. km772]